MPTPSLSTQKEITLNLDKPNDLIYFKTKQYDALSRNIKINLLFNDAPWTLPGSISISSFPLSSSYIYAMVRYKKPDGTCGMYDTDEEGNQAVTGTSGNSYITVRLAEQILIVEGKVVTEINFYNADGQKLTAFSFIIDVEKSSISDEQYVSSDYYNLLRHDIAAIYQVNEAFVSATQAAISGILTIDDTLSIHGAIADAKAAGDMVQMRETQPSETSNILWIKDPEEEIIIPVWEDILQMIAPEYSNEEYYSVNSYCIHDGKLYKCNTDISVFENWDPSHWEQTTVMTEIANLL